MSKSFDKYIKKEEIYWPLWTQSYIFEYKDDEISKNDKSLIDFVCNRLTFGYASPFKNDFNPMAQFDGKRSIIYSDLGDNDFEQIKTLIKHTSNDYILAKCNDILFIKTNEERYCRDAINSFIKIAEHFISAKKVFGALDYIKRVLFLYRSINDHNGISNTIDSFVFVKRYSKINDLERVINAVFDFLKECKYTKYDKKNLINKMSTLDIDISDDGLKLIKNIIDYYSSIHNVEQQNIWNNKYADICEKLCESTSPRGYKYIKFAIDILSKQGELNEERINDLRFKLEEEQAKFFDSFQFQGIPIGDEINGKINKHIQDAVEYIKNGRDSISKFSRLWKVFIPVKEKELNSFSKEMENSIFESLCNQVIFDKDKKVVEEIGPDETEKRHKQNIIQGYVLFHSIYLPIAAGYFETVTIDKGLEELITDIVSHNDFVPSNRIGIVKDFIIQGLNKKIRQSLYNLISQFEYGCVAYLKNNKKVHPSITKGSMTVTIDLNHILTNVKFRKHIVDILGEDLTKEIQFLLVEKHYGNLRNKDYHEGYDREDVFTNIELLAYYRLLQVYCMGYKGQYD